MLTNADVRMLAYADVCCRMLLQVDPLSRLERLQLQGNRLEELPEQFEYLTALTFVDLTGNLLYLHADVC